MAPYRGLFRRLRHLPMCLRELTRLLGGHPCTSRPASGSASPWLPSGRSPLRQHRHVLKAVQHQLVARRLCRRLCGLGLLATREGCMVDHLLILRSKRRRRHQDDCKDRYAPSQPRDRRHPQSPLVRLRGWMFWPEQSNTRLLPGVECLWQPVRDGSTRSVQRLGTQTAARRCREQERSPRCRVDCVRVVWWDQRRDALGRGAVKRSPTDRLAQRDHDLEGVVRVDVAVDATGPNVERRARDRERVGSDGRDHRGRSPRRPRGPAAPVLGLPTVRVDGIDANGTPARALRMGSPVEPSGPAGSRRATCSRVPPVRR